MPPDPKRVQAVFLAAVEQPDPASRAAVLDRECSDDPELRGRVEALMRAHDRPDHAFDRIGVPLPGPNDGEAAPVEPDGLVTVDRPSPPAITEGPGSRIGPYKLLQKIGEGGFGAVYMAEQERPIRRMVAVKIIKPGMDSGEVIARFESERQALAMMDHPNIAKVLDAGATESGRPYFVMELVKGVPITEFCDQNRLTPRERLDLPPRSPNCNAHLERFFRSLKDETLSRLILFGEAALCNAIEEFLAHYHRERAHQGLGHRMLEPGLEVGQQDGEIDCRERLGGLLKYYHRQAA